MVEPVVGEHSSVLNKSRKHASLFIYVVTLLSAVGGFLFGYDTGVVSGAMLLLRTYFELNYIWQEFVVSVTIVTAWLFALIGGNLTDRFGRKPIIISASFVFTVGSLLMGFAEDRIMLVCGRVVVGIGIGFASMTVPMYIAEVAPADIRGRLVTINSCCITFGQLSAGIVAGIFSGDSQHGWRYMLGIAAVPSVIQFFGFLFMPESPRWLISRGFYNNAVEVLQKIRGEGENVQEEFENIKASCLEIEREKLSRNDNSPVIIQVLKSPTLRRALIVGCSLQIIQQLAGINTVMYYSATIIEMSGVKGQTKIIWLSAATAGMNFICSFIGLLFVERIGRRKLTLISLASVVFALSFLAVGFQIAYLSSPVLAYHDSSVNGTVCGSVNSCGDCVNLADCGYCFVDDKSGPVNGTCLVVDLNHPENSAHGSCSFDSEHHKPAGTTWAYQWCPSAYSWMTILGLLLYLLCFAPGLGSTPWTINSEIYPLWARSTCYSTATSFNWLFNFIVSLSFLSLTQALTKHGAFWLYASFSALGFIFLFLMLPETRGKSLEEVEGLFAHPWWKEQNSDNDRKSDKTDNIPTSTCISQLKAEMAETFVGDGI